MPRDGAITFRDIVGKRAPHLNRSYLTNAPKWVVTLSRSDRRHTTIEQA
jgi:hypothetical protein